MTLTLAFLLLTTLASALIAGLFYAYQWSVMPGLNAIEPLAAIKAMNSINVVILNPVFFFSFFGTLLFGAATAILYLWTARDAATLCVWAGFLAYAIGTFGVTIVFNVPLNNRLAASSPTAAAAATIWREYYDPWMYWNLIRTLAAIAAFILFVTALWLSKNEF